MPTKKQEQQFTEIAKRNLQIETLEERKSDSLDFHEVSVWGVKRALEEAFELGRQAGNK